MLKRNLRVDWRDENRKMNINDFFLSDWDAIGSIYDLYSYYVSLNLDLKMIFAASKYISTYLYLAQLVVSTC